MNRILLLVVTIALSAASPFVQAAGDAQAGKQKAASCAGCHGANGEGKSAFPKLAGIPEVKMIKELKEYKSGAGSNGMMKSLAAKLSDQDMADIAAYYASLK